MQPKILIYSQTEDRDNEIWKILKEYRIESNNSDLLIIEDEKVGVPETKQIIRHLSSKPFGKTAKSVVIFNGNNISNDAQNALLKTLEEPPTESLILIAADSETRFLPTVLSRCGIIRLKQGSAGKETGFDLEKILKADTEERFEIIEKTADKDKFLSEFTAVYRNKVMETGSGGEMLDELLQAGIWKQSNVNVRTILEYLMLRIPKQS